MNPPQEARLKYINKVLSQSQGLFSWKSDGTFLKGRIMNFPVRMYDTSPMIAEINGVPVYFRFDFQTRQGLWIPGEILTGHEMPAETSSYSETSEPIAAPRTTGKGIVVEIFPYWSGSGDCGWISGGIDTIGKTMRVKMIVTLTSMGLIFTAPAFGQNKAGELKTTVVIIFCGPGSTTPR